jgi:type III secretory pathway component EscU
MVMPNVRSRRGSSTGGCLISLVLFIAAVYYGIHLGEPWFRYYQLVDEMRVSARLAPTLSDPVIRRRLEQKVDELQIPADAKKKFTITRSGNPRKITISTQYSETVTVPLLTHTFLFTPTTEEPL